METCRCASPNGRHSEYYRCGLAAFDDACTYDCGGTNAAASAGHFAIDLYAAARWRRHSRRSSTSFIYL